MTDNRPKWVKSGNGVTPEHQWSFTADAPLVCASYGRETGEYALADSSGGLYVLNSQGKVTSLNHGFHSLGHIDWSDCGAGGIVSINGATLCRISDKLKVVWSIDFADDIADIAIDPRGDYIHVSLKNGYNMFYNTYRKKIAQYKTVKPLKYTEFLPSEPCLVAAADQGLIGSYDLKGEEIWTENSWASVGGLSATGDGKYLYVAAHNHGVKQYRNNGAQQDNLALEGTPNHVSASFSNNRLGITTLEKHLYWIDDKGAMVWVAEIPEIAASLIAGPMGKSLFIGFESGRVTKLGWM